MTKVTGDADAAHYDFAAKFDTAELSTATGGSRLDSRSIAERAATGQTEKMGGAGGTGEWGDRTLRRVESYGGRGGLDSRLLDKARGLIDSMNTDDEIALRLCLQDFAGTLASLWRNSAGCSQPHEDILATLQRAALEAKSGDVGSDQIRAFREAVGDLSQEHLTPAHADNIRSRFLDVGFSALSFLTSGVSESCE